MAISDKSRKVLWGRSGNRCAICRIELVLEKDPFNKHLNIGEECHIISKQASGPRHKLLDDFDYDSSNNLLLLCSIHHKMIDEQVEQYSEDSLQKRKYDHETWVKTNLDNDFNSEGVKEASKLSNLIDFVKSKHDIEMKIKSSKQIIDSDEGLQIVFSEVDKIKSFVYEIVSSLNASAPDYHIEVRDNKQHICDIRFKEHTLLVQFYQAHNNTAKDSYLLFGIIDGLFDEKGTADPIYPPKVFKLIRLNFGYDENDKFGWRDQTNKEIFYLSKDITILWTDQFFRYILK